MWNRKYSVNHWEYQTFSANQLEWEGNNNNNNNNKFIYTAHFQIDCSMRNTKKLMNWEAKPSMHTTSNNITSTKTIQQYLQN